MSSQPKALHFGAGQPDLFGAPRPEPVDLEARATGAGGVMVAGCLHGITVGAPDGTRRCESCGAAVRTDLPRLRREGGT